MSVHAGSNANRFPRVRSTYGELADRPGRPAALCLLLSWILVFSTVGLPEPVLGQTPKRSAGADGAYREWKRNLTTDFPTNSERDGEMLPSGGTQNPSHKRLGSHALVGYQRSAGNGPQPVLAPSTAQPLPVSAQASLEVPLPIDVQVLDGHDIACRAARNWIPADILRARAKAVVQAYCEEDDCARRAAAVLSHFLHMQALHQEDIGAASALRAYYTRISLEEQLEIVRQSREYVDQEALRQHAIQDRGLAAGADLSSFDRLRLELEDKRLQLLSQDRQLRCVLAQLAKVDYDMDAVQQEQLEVFECSLDCERLKQLAFANRYDLRGWSYLACHVTPESAPVFAKMLSSLVGGFGLPLPTISGLKAILCPPDFSCLAANMRHELDLTVETHRQWICQAVDEKCSKLQLAYQRIQLAQQTVDSWEARLAQLERLEETGNGEPAERATANSELLKARSQEVSRRLDAKLAEVDLAEASGGIRDRCCGRQPWLLTGYE